MAAKGLPAALKHVLGWALLLAVLASCAPQEDSPYPVPSGGGKVRFSAQWLKSQPGQSFGDFSLHLLSADSEPIADWPGLAASQQTLGSGREFSLRLARNAPDDFYLYVVYPGEAFAYDGLSLAAGREDEFLTLAVAQRHENMLVLGITRVGDRRGQPQRSGELLRLKFAAGREDVFRSVSTVNEDPASAPQLLLEGGSGETAELSWIERNIGDYNNNSQVEISDITPIGIYFGQGLSGAEDPEKLRLVDGDENGLITIADLTPIGRNFGSGLDGYVVYRATGDNPQPADFTALGRPSLERSAVFDGLTGDERLRRLRIPYSAPAQTGQNHYYVRAWSDDGISGSEGPQSNVVSFESTPGNLAPIWLTSSGIVSAEGINGGLRLSFGAGEDPEGGPVTFVLRYVEGFAPVGGAGTQSVEFAQEGLPGPPYSYELSGLSRGSTYTMNLQLKDSEGNRSSNNEQLQAAVPALGVSSDPWAMQRRDPQRSGANPASTLKEPLALAWDSELEADSTRSVLAGEAQWLTVADDLNVLRRFQLADGAAAGSHPALSGFPRGLSLDSPRLAAGAPSGSALYDVSTQSAAELYPGTAAYATLLLGEYMLLAQSDGQRALSTGSGAELWSHLPAGESYSLLPAADATHLYAVSDDGSLSKLELLEGESVLSGNLGEEPQPATPIAVEAQHGSLLVPTAAGDLLVLSSTDFSLKERLSGYGGPLASAPCVVQSAQPALIAAARVAAAGEGFSWTLEAFDSESLQPLWDISGSSDSDSRPQLSAGQDRFFLAVGSRLYCIDFAGRLRQSIELPGAALGEPLALEDSLALLSPGLLLSLGQAEPDNPPVWQGAQGISAISNASGEITIEWGSATDDHNEPVNYVIYYRAGGPPALSEPYGDTVLVTDIAHSGPSHSHTVTGLTDGTRYYAAVRAYDGYWDDGPQTDSNANVLGTTPPWQLERLDVGAELPAGQINFMRGITAPDGSLHLVYNREADASLVHVFGTTGAWQSEGSQLSQRIAVGFDALWDDDLVIARAIPGSSGGALTRRMGSDLWEDEVFSDTEAAPNPQVAAALGGVSFFAYTEFIVGGFPNVEEHYYLKRTAGSDWQDPEVLDSENFSGRDLQLLPDPQDAAQPWLAFQRGFNNAPNRLTPQDGQLMFARHDGSGGFALELVDAGENVPDSDCGKRVRMLIGAGGRPRLAYLDLDASASQRRGQLRFAEHDGSAWSTELITELDLSFQSASNQFTYCELGFAEADSGAALIGLLRRQFLGDDAFSAHPMVSELWIGDEAGWRSERITDEQTVFPRDREPCVLLVDAAGDWHLFYVSAQDPLDPEADCIMHWYRAAP